MLLALVFIVFINIYERCLAVQCWTDDVRGSMIGCYTYRICVRSTWKYMSCSPSNPMLSDHRCLSIDQYYKEKFRWKDCTLGKKYPSDNIMSYLECAFTSDGNGTELVKKCCESCGNFYYNFQECHIPGGSVCNQQIFNIGYVGSTPTVSELERSVILNRRLPKKKKILHPIHRIQKHPTPKNIQVKPNHSKAKPNHSNVKPNHSKVKPNHSKVKPNHSRDLINNHPKKKSAPINPVGKMCDLGDVKPNFKDCSKYYKCHRGLWMEMACPDKKQYDLISRRCRTSGAWCPQSPPRL